MSHDYSTELNVAMLAAQRAAILTRRLFCETVKGRIEKADNTPVTVGDFGAQALIISAIHHLFPDDQIMGEESAGELREDSGLCERVWAQVEQTSHPDAEAEALIGGAVPSKDRMLDLIDIGNSEGGRVGRFWTIDPIDGTKGFLSGRQYSIVIALIVDGVVEVSALGGPNLLIDNPVDVKAANETSDEKKGVLYTAMRGHGAFVQPLFTNLTADITTLPDDVRVKLTASTTDDPTGCRYIEGHLARHDGTDHERIGTVLGFSEPSIRLDSESKYCIASSGVDALFLKVPLWCRRTDSWYKQFIWDHAAGVLIASEAGCWTSDLLGQPLDFGCGREMKLELGIVVCPFSIHNQVLYAIRSVIGTDEEYFAQFV